MRVLALVTEAFGGSGGIAQYNRDLCRAMAACGAAEVTIVPRWSLDSEEALPDGVTQLPAAGARIGYALGAVLRPHPPVHIVFCGHLHLAPLACLLARRYGARLWLQIHGIEAWQEPSALQRQAADRADLVTAVSRHTRRRFLRWASVASERVRVLPSTYHERFAPGPGSDRLRHRFNLQGKRVLLTVGRLSSSEGYKGQDRVIRLLPAIRNAVPEIAYIVAGNGDDRARLTRLARDAQVEDLVRFIGTVPPSELPDLYRSADVFVMPSTGEGFGIVFLEAAASGLPVIGGSRDGSVDALRDGTVGTLVDPDDSQQLMNAILAALMADGEAPADLHVFDRRNFEYYARSLLNVLRPE